MMLSLIRSPVGQFFSLLGLYCLAVAAPIPTAVAAMSLFFLRWKNIVQEPDEWWRMKSVVLVATVPVIAAAAVSPAAYPLANFMLLLNMASTLRRPQDRLESLNSVLGVSLMCYAAGFGWTPLSGSGVSSFPLPWWWIAAYTVWNQVFVAVRFPEAVYRCASMLAAPLAVAALFGPECWFYARGTTLALGVIIGMSLPKGETIAVD